MTTPVAPLEAARPWWRRLALSLGWSTLVVALVIALHALGSGRLAAPPLLVPEDLGAWLDQRGGVTAAFAVIRLIALIGAWYLLGITVLGLVARASRIPRLVELADLGTLPGMRRVLGAVAGVGLGASAATLFAGGHLGAERPAAEAAVAGTGATAGDEAMPVVLQRLDATDDATDDDSDRTDAGRATMRVIEEPAPPGTRAGDAPVPTTWTTRPGDHFWRIAESTLTEAWGRAPSDDEIAPYWRRVVEANRADLADPANPDLVLPGQTFVLPPSPAP